MRGGAIGSLFSWKSAKLWLTSNSLDPTRFPSAYCLANVDQLIYLPKN